MAPKPVRLRPEFIAAGTDRAEQLGLSFALYVRLLVHADIFEFWPLRPQPPAVGRFSRVSTSITFTARLWSLVRKRSAKFGLTRPCYIEQLIARELSAAKQSLEIYPAPATKKPALKFRAE